MVASCTWEKRPSITQPLKSRAGEVVEDGGGWGRLLRDAPPPAFPNLLRPPPTSGAVAPSIAIANRTRPHPASRRGIPVARDRKSTRLNSSHTVISYAV